MADFDFTKLEEEEAKRKGAKKDVQKFDFSAIDAEEQKREEADSTASKIQRQLEIFGRGVLRSIDLPFDLIELATMIPGDPKAPGRGLVESFGKFSIAEPISEALDLAKPERGSIADQATTEAGAALIPGLGLIKLGKSALQRAPGFIRNLTEEAGKSPLKFLAAEETIAAGAGTSRALAEKADADPMVVLLAELGGSIATSGLLRAGRAIATPFRPKLGEGQAKTKAAQILQEAATDVEGSVKKLEDASPTLTSAQAAEDLGLLGIERPVARGPKGKEAFIQAKNETNQAARRELDEISQGDPERARNFIEARVERIDKAIDDSVQKAVDEANDQISALPKGTNTGQISEVAVEALDGALVKARGVETAAWNNVNFNVQVDTTPLKNLAVELEGVGKAQKAIGTKLPKEIKELLQLPDSKGKVPRGTFNQFETAQEIQNFRSQILDAARDNAASATPDRRLAAIYNKLADTALEILEGGERVAAGFGPEEVLLYKQALEITKKLNKKFYTGDIGKVMKFSTGGVRKVDESVVLNRILKPGPEGASNARRFVDTVGAEKAKEISADFLERNFVHQAQNADGTLDVGSARRFIKNNSELLDEFPELKAQLNKTIDTVEKSGKKIKIGAARSKAINERAKASLLLGRDVEKVVPKIRGEKDPVAAAKQIAKTLSKDPQASQGFKRMFIDDIFKNAESKAAGGLDEPLLREAGFRSYLRDNRKIMKAAGFSDDELGRLDSVANNLRKMELSAQKVGGSDTAENLTGLQSLIGRVGGASLMRALGFSTIQATGAGAKLGQNIMRSLTSTQAGAIIEEAIFDQALMRELLLRPTSKNTPIIINRLRGHFANIGVDIDAIFQEEEQPQAQGVQF